MFLASLVIVIALMLFAGGTAMAAAPTQEGTTEVVTSVVTSTLEIPFLDEWLASPHADASAEAFRHWDTEDPAEVPESCAKCHSTPGYQDYLGADGTEPNVVDHPAAVGSVVECVACHNDVTLVKDSVVMPSGLELVNLGDDSRCIECHQGRESTVSVNASIEEAGVDDDTVSEDLGFLNIHYYAAAATKYGTLAKGGYEYEGMAYDANFAHVEGFNTCTDCHSPHTLELDVEACATCHEGVTSVEDLRNVRMAGSQVDYDGDGDVEEGIASELAGAQEVLYGAIQAYAADVAGTAIIYEPSAHPYFFADTNANGAVDADEVNADNRFAAWTPRLLRAAYNYQVSIKDPGAYAHGGKYIIELLYDATADLNTALAEPVDMAAMRRIDAGHFAGSEEAFRHWDAEGEVPASCAKCHSASGLPTFLEQGVSVSAQPANGFQCTTCHNDLAEFTLHEVEEVTFPSGAVVSATPETNLCLNCHQGRESGADVDNLIGDADADTVSESLRFLNVHYFAAGATRYGGEVNGAYQYEGKEYAGFFDHSNSMNECNDCHATHSLEVDAAACAECHEQVEEGGDVRDIRYYDDDLDGDGDVEEGMAYEIETMLEVLYTQLQAYAADEVGTPIVYDSHSHPYFFTDTNGNGEPDPDETTGENQYNTWTPRLLRAAYNYQYVQKDPGAFVHNGVYITQVLQDSIEDLGGDVSGMLRP
jgi:hypothetical protein